MKKGDIKRNSILKAAETLFFERGFERTSIQDILDALSLSKGGFYHHFPSKEAILEEICVSYVEKRFERLNGELHGGRLSPVEKLNTLLRRTNLISQDRPQFVALVMKHCYINGDVRLRDHLRSTIATRIRAHLSDVIQEGISSGDFFVRHPGQVGEIILSLVCDADDRVCRILCANADSPECLIDVAELLEAYRDAVETILNAQHGTIELVNMERFVNDYRDAAASLLEMEERK